MPPCPYCGQGHPVGTAFCPVTGRPLAAGAPPQPPSPYGWPPQAYVPPAQGYGSPYGPPPQPGLGYAPLAPFGGAKPVTAILNEALTLYQRNLGAFLVTGALAVAPFALLKALATVAFLPPSAAAPATFEGGLVALALGLLVVVVGLVLMYGLAVPLATGALTIVVADRAVGGSLGPADAYGLLLKRLGLLLSAQALAFVFVLLGLCFLLLPGMILGFLFSFVTPVVLIEGVGGMTALRRSIDLVKANAAEVFVVSLVFGALELAAHVTASMFIPRYAVLLGSLVEDATMITLLPIPIIGSVLLYLDVRRQREGFDATALGASVESLRRG